MPKTDAYWAFLSYSHRDHRWAAWLHRALETYRVPPALVGRDSPYGPIPERLRPIFRDREELAASSALGERLTEALDRSRFLIVLCSCEAAASRWTNEEILAFKRRHSADRIFAAIVGGEPFASGMDGREAEECLPPALRFELAADGTISDRPAEPLAADFRPRGDGKRMAFLKLVAGMLGVGLDDLVQRDQLRRTRRMAWLTAASLAGMGITSTLAVMAVQARDQASYQREQADGLIEFMLTDLRRRLEPAGRLDLLDGVGKKALTYYEGQDERDLSSEALGRQARARLLVGEVANLRGDLPQAQSAYRLAARTTAEQLRRHPDDADRLFDHAQSEFWVGYLAYQQADYATARQHMERYLALAERMMAVAPNDPRSLTELGYARSNIGSVAMKQGRYDEACSAFEAGFPIADRLMRNAKDRRQAMIDAAQWRGWSATCEHERGQLDKAIAARKAELRLYDQLLATDPNDARVLLSRIVALTEQVRIPLSQGRRDVAANAEAIAIGRRLVAQDPSNIDPLDMLVGAMLTEGLRRSYTGDHRGALAIYDEALARGRAMSGPTATAEARYRLGTRVLVALADAQRRAGQAASARQTAQAAIAQLLPPGQSPTKLDNDRFASWLRATAIALPPSNQAAWRQVARHVEARPDVGASVEISGFHALALARSGQRDRADAQIARLHARGVRPPMIEDLWRAQAPAVARLLPPVRPDERPRSAQRKG